MPRAFPSSVALRLVAATCLSAAVLMIVGCQKATVADRPSPVQAPPTTRAPAVPTLLKTAVPLPPAQADNVGNSELSRQVSELSASALQEVVKIPLPGDGRPKTKVGLLLPLSGP